MGLITDKIEIFIDSRTAPHYQALGYNVPWYINEKGKLAVQKIPVEVSATHLPERSNRVVEVECDRCHTIKHIHYDVYNRVNKKRNGYYCHVCTIALFQSGENNPNWNSNKTLEERSHDRLCQEYMFFIKQVLRRDDYACQICRAKNNGLIVHHLDGYNWCIEKRTDINNGITLCKTCHSNFHSIYGKGDNTKEQFEQFFHNVDDILSKKIKPVSIKSYPARGIYCVEDNIVYNNYKECIESVGSKNDAGIYNVCNSNNKSLTFYGKHYIWKNDFDKLSQSEKEQYIDFCLFDSKYRNKVICLNTGEVFSSAKEASKNYGVSLRGIRYCCNGTCTSSGSLDYLPLQWALYSDFVCGKRKYNDKLVKFVNPRPVIYINTMTIYNSGKEASSGANVSASLVTHICKHTKNGPHKFMYYDEYKELSQEEQIKLQEKYYKQLE